MYVCKGMKLVVNVAFQPLPLLSSLSLPHLQWTFCVHHTCTYITPYICTHSTARTALSWNSLHFSRTWDLFWSPWCCWTCRLACLLADFWTSISMYNKKKRKVIHDIIFGFGRTSAICWKWRRSWKKLQMYSRLSKRPTINILFKMVTVVPMRTSVHSAVDLRKKSQVNQGTLLF